VFSFISNEYDKIKCFKKSVVGYIVGWTPEYLGCLGYIVGWIPEYFGCLGYIVGWTPEFFGCLGYIVGWTPEFFSCLGYIASCGYPTRTHTHTRGNSSINILDRSSVSFNSFSFVTGRSSFVKMWRKAV
jgi:hypothetical protein